MLQELYESIHFSSDFPVKVFLSQLGYVAPHWHQSIELILVLEGEIDAKIDGELFHLAPEDLVLINSNTVHEMSASHAVSIALQFSPETFSLTHENMDTLTFDCNSSIDSAPERYMLLRRLIAALVQNNTHTNAGTPYRNNALYLTLISELMTAFRSSASESVKSKRKHAARMTQILEYIDQHYQENFSLADLAGVQQLSVPYLSSFFNRQMGIGFAQYYTSVKLEHAVYMLTTTDLSIEAVAAANGFPEPHAFVRAFKKRFGVLPSAYRKHQIKEALNRSALGQTNYIKLEPTNYLHLLTRYLDASDPFSTRTTPKMTTEVKKQPPVSCLVPGTPLRSTYRTITSVARASDLLQTDVLEMLRRLQKEVSFRYIKFHGLFSDEMMIVTRNADGSVHFNFSLVDRVLENLLDIGLKPWMQLAFMPTVLASDPAKTIFMAPMNTSPPADMEEWVLLVKTLCEHLLSRFGRDEVRTWPFCVWSEPDTPVSMFGWADLELFQNFYKRTCQAVKSVCPQIQFGTPSLLYMRHNDDSTWIRHFLAFAQNSRCRPDFLNIHYYADMLPTSHHIGRVELAPRSRFPEDPDDLRDFIRELRGIFQDCGVGELPIYLTEWNLTFSHRNLINDTVFKSCYLVRNILENFDNLDSFGYWCLTDLHAENAVPDELFHGGLGMVTMNGIRKPVFHAFRLLGMLGDTLLAKGNGYFITRKGGQIIIMTYHYIHYGSLFAAGESFNMTATDRYSIFDMTQKLTLSIPLTDLTENRYRVKEWYINREHGSIFDDWLKSGALSLTHAEAVEMDRVCSPGFVQEEVFPDHGQLLYSATLEPLEVRCAVFTPI